MKLRPYQDETVDSIFREFTSGDSTLAVLPTGCGKTVIFSEVCRRWNHNRILVMAHRDELIQQAADKIQEHTGERPEIEMGECRAVGSMFSRSNVVVTSVQTMSRESRHSDFRPEDFGLLIIDEAHHAPAASYRRVIDYFKRGNLKILGVTATPNRADELALGQIFGSVAKEYGVVDAINDGWLVPVHQEMIYIESLDFSQVKKTAGDLNQKQLEEIMSADGPLYEVADASAKCAGDRPTLIFAAGVAQAHALAEILSESYGKTAVALDGETETEHRRDQIERFKQGEIQFLCNCGLFLEGFDAPNTAVVVMARPTMSQALYAQMLGRGTRPLPGVVDGCESAAERRLMIEESAKPNMLVLDFVGNSGRHKLVSAADILGGKFADEAVEKAKEIARQEAIEKAKTKEEDGELSESRGGRAVFDQLDHAEKLIEEERRAARRQIIANARFSRQAVSPFDVLDFVPGREPGWHKGRPATEKQIETLARAGFGDKDLQDVGFWKAHQLIDKLIDRRKQDLCTIKQAKVLAKYGEKTDVSFTDARRLIDAIAAKGWKPLTDDDRRSVCDLQAAGAGAVA